MFTFDMCVEARSCFVDHTFNKHAKAGDHLPLRVNASFPGRARRPITKTRHLPYSKLAIQKDTKLGRLQPNDRRTRVSNRLNALPLMPVTLDNSSHAFVHHKAAVNIIVEEYPPDEKYLRFNG